MVVAPLYCVRFDKPVGGRDREKEVTPGPNCIQRGRLHWLHANLCLHSASTESRSRCCNPTPTVWDIFWFLMVAFLSIKPGARLVPEWAVKKISSQTVI